MVISQMFCTFIIEIQTVAKTLDMTADCKITELFCIINELCKHFEAENTGN